MNTLFFIIALLALNGISFCVVVFFITLFKLELRTPQIIFLTALLTSSYFLIQ